MGGGTGTGGEQVHFDTKILGLANYWEELGKINYGSELAQGESVDAYQLPAIWGSIGHLLVKKPIEQGFTKAREELDVQVLQHAQTEYIHRGIEDRSLQQDSEAERQERAGLLAVMAAPRSPEDFYRKSAVISSFLGSLTVGERMVIPEFKRGIFIHFSKEFNLDTTRDSFAIPQGGYLDIKYESKDEWDVQQGIKELACEMSLQALLEQDATTLNAQ